MKILCLQMSFYFIYNFSIYFKIDIFGLYILELYLFFAHVMLLYITGPLLFILVTT